MVEAFDVEVAGGGRARAVRVLAESELGQAIAALAVPCAPVVLLYGGAAKVGADDTARIERFFAVSFIPAVAELGGIVVDGGTDAGVMRMVGEARGRVGKGIRLVGVAPFWKVSAPGSTGSTALAPGHTDFVLVPGTEWGAESRWFHPIADMLSSGLTATMLVNGGPIALEEIQHSIDRGGRVFVVEGTGRAADDVTAAIRRPDGPTSRLSTIAASPWTIVVDVTIGAAELADELATTAARETGL